MGSRSLQRAIVGSAVCATALLGFGAGQASAGEITGNGDSLWVAPHTLSGKSECAFSGLNDEYYVLHDLTASRTQTFPQYKRDFEPDLPPGTPGYACNPHGR